MSYIRVVPRDLFNEANLLKCYGQIYLNLERLNTKARLITDGRPFQVDQDPASGSLTISNVSLIIRRTYCPLERPLNSREPFPLYATLRDTCVSVFNDDGTFTAEMLKLLGR